MIFAAGCGSADRVSAPGVLVPAAPVQLAFRVQPAAYVATGVPTPGVEVAVLDANGNVVTNAATSISLSLVGGPSPATLGGVTTSSAVSGVAAFPAWTVPQPGSGYALTATAAGLAGATSTTFVVKLAIIAVSSGVEHTCALTAAGRAYCWGYNADSQLGDSSNTQRFTPVAVAGGLTFASISVGDTHSCALTAAGAAWCWGSNQVGLLGNGTGTLGGVSSSVPVPVAGGLRFSSLRAGSGHNCGTTAAGTAYCWGYNSNGQLGTGDSVFRNAPVAVAGSNSFAVVSASHHFTEMTCGVSTTGTALCWGNNALGLFGNGTLAGNPFPTPVSGSRVYTDVSVGETHACALDTTGSVSCWGSNYWGQLGIGSTRDSLLPALVAGGLRFASISVGYETTCGVTVSAAGYCWGDGPLGNGTTSTITPSPSLILGGLSFVSISVGGSHACGVTTTRLLYCWGVNNWGQRGDGAAGPANAPLPLVVGP